MHAVFVASLFGGALAIALFTALGAAGGGHAGGHAHAGHVHADHGWHPGHGAHGHAAAHSHGAAENGSGPGQNPLSASLGWALSWLSPITVAGAALWFGAGGLLLEGVSGTVALIAAVIAALIGAVLVRALMAAFLRAGTPPLQLSGDGAIATVNAAIRADAPGEVVYTLEGLHRSMPARSADGSAIPRGTAVVIVRREKGMAWVEPLDPLAELGAGGQVLESNGAAPISADPADGDPRGIVQIERKE